MALIGLAAYLSWSCGYDSRGSAQDQFQAMTPEQRVDFIYAMATPEIRRAIAEDWCAINRRTRGICGRARMVAPIGGGR